MGRGHQVGIARHEQLHIFERFGIARHEQLHIFERFGRGSKQRRSDGSGLGLVVVRSIAEVHDGHVVVDSQIGRGARVTLALPLTTRAARPSDSGAPSPTPVSSEAAR